MIHSKPKASILISLGFVLMCILIADGWLFVALVQHPESYFWWKLILAPTLLVAAIAIARKGYQAALQLSLGNNQLTYRFLLGASKSCKIAEIKSWREEVVKNNKIEYKRLTILLANGDALQLSDKENSNYQPAVNYLKKKVKTTKSRS